MPRSLARPPRHEHRDRGRRRRTHRWAHRRSWKKTKAATPSAYPRLWQHSATVQWLQRRGAANCPQPSNHHITTPERRRGCRHAFQPVMAAETSSRRREEEQEPQQGQAGTDRATRGRTHLGQRTEAMAMDGGEITRSPWSEERAWGGGANAPHSGGGNRRSSPESSGKVVGDSRSPGERERLGLGSSRGWERGCGQLGRAGPV
jgi:hypothetical protein